MKNAKHHPLLDKLYQGKPFNLLDYTGNLKHQICGDVAWDLFAEKNAAVQAARAKVVIESMRAAGQEEWATLQISYFRHFKINYTE